MKYSAQYSISPAMFHVISWKIDTFGTKQDFLEKNTVHARFSFQIGAYPWFLLVTCMYRISIQFREYPGFLLMFVHCACSMLPLKYGHRQGFFLGRAYLGFPFSQLHTYPGFLFRYCTVCSVQYVHLQDFPLVARISRVSFQTRAHQRLPVSNVHIQSFSLEACISGVLLRYSTCISMIFL